MGVNTLKLFPLSKQVHRSFKAAVLALALTSTALPAFAQELAPEHLALARRYVDLTDNNSVYEVTLVQVAVETMRTILSQNPDLTDTVDTAITAVLDTYRDRKGELLDQFARVYALRFTMEELQQIVTFYESPVGSKLVTVNAQAGQDLQAIQEVFEVNLRTEFFAQVRAELREAGVNL
jgi:uncharacterized protein